MPGLNERSETFSRLMALIRYPLGKLVQQGSLERLPCCATFSFVERCHSSGTTMRTRSNKFLPSLLLLLTLIGALTIDRGEEGESSSAVHSVSDDVLAL